MTITTNKGGFTEAELKTEFHARIRAESDNLYDPAFFVTLPSFNPDADGRGYFFDHASCVEAAEFFAMLAAELLRRRAEEEGCDDEEEGCDDDQG